MMPAAAPHSVRRPTITWPAHHRAWLQHLDRIVVPPPPFERAAGPRLRPFPTWPHHSAPSSGRPAAK